MIVLVIVNGTMVPEISIINSTSLPEVLTAHGNGIMKRVIANKEIVPPVTQLSLVDFQPGQKVETHKHESMHEIYFVLNGTVTVNGRSVRKNECVIIPAQVEHDVANLTEEVVCWFAVAVATGSS